jgi:outer membrane protein OmpA-like peptidoglycan-associated protein
VNALQAFVKLVKGKPNLVIEIVGIATSSHPSSTDKQLATRRAKTMMAMFKQLNVVAKFISSIKVAGTKPIATLAASWGVN